MTDDEAKAIEDRLVAQILRSRANAEWHLADCDFQDCPVCIRIRVELSAIRLK